LLASEIQRLRERLAGLRDTLNVFGEREQALRLLAGLTPIDKDVQQAGIGAERSVVRTRQPSRPLVRTGSRRWPRASTWIS